MSNLALIIEDTNYGAFKNNNFYSGSLTISGTTSAGANLKTFSVSLLSIPDMVDIIFNGPVDSGVDIRPANGWFKQSIGQIFNTISVLGNNVPAGYVDYPTNWQVYGTIDGSALTVSAVYTQQFTDVLTLTSTDFSYRLVDYSGV